MPSVAHRGGRRTHARRGDRRGNAVFGHESSEVAIRVASPHHCVTLYNYIRLEETATGRGRAVNVRHPHRECRIGVLPTTISVAFPGGRRSHRISYSSRIHGGQEVSIALALGRGADGIRAGHWRRLPHRTQAALRLDASPASGTPRLRRTSTRRHGSRPRRRTSRATHSAQSIRRGLALVTHTADSLPTYAPGKLNCTNCHLNGGRNVDAAPLAGSQARFPKYMDRTGAVIGLADRVNYCFTRSLAGNRLPVESREMQDILAYIAWLSSGVPVGEGKKLPGRRRIRVNARCSSSATGARRGGVHGEMRGVPRRRRARQSRDSAGRATRSGARSRSASARRWRGRGRRHRSSGTTCRSAKGKRSPSKKRSTSRRTSPHKHAPTRRERARLAGRRHAGRRAVRDEGPSGISTAAAPDPLPTRPGDSSRDPHRSRTALHERRADLASNAARRRGRRCGRPVAREASERKGAGSRRLPVVPADPGAMPGGPTTPLSMRSPFENPSRTPAGVITGPASRPSTS